MALRGIHAPREAVRPCTDLSLPFFTPEYLHKGGGWAIAADRRCAFVNSVMCFFPLSRKKDLFKF
jgi:hypothetical protein